MYNSIFSSGPDHFILLLTLNLTSYYHFYLSFLSDTLSWLNGRLENNKSDIKSKLNKLSFETGIMNTEVLFATLKFRTTQTTKRLRAAENVKLVTEQNDSSDVNKKAKGGMKFLCI